MKRINFLMALLLFATVGVFTSCTEDLGDNAAPTVTISGGADGEYTEGSTVALTITVKDSDGELATLSISPSSAGAAGTGITSTTPTAALETNGTTFMKDMDNVVIMYDYVVPAASSVSQVTITVTATDDAGDASTAQTVSFDVKAESTAFESTVHNGSINHVWGADQGGWNMISHTGVSQSTNNWAGAHIVNINEASIAGEAKPFEAKWTGSSSDPDTKWALLSGADFAAVGVETVKDATASGSVDMKTAAAEGQVYGADLGNGKFAVMKITKISMTGTSSYKAGEGYLDFQYKLGQLATSK
jgi:hypothetical protein